MASPGKSSSTGYLTGRLGCFEDTPGSNWGSGPTRQGFHGLRGCNAGASIVVDAGWPAADTACAGAMGLHEPDYLCRPGGTQARYRQFSQRTESNSGHRGLSSGTRAPRVWNLGTPMINRRPRKTSSTRLRRRSKSNTTRSSTPGCCFRWMTPSSLATTIGFWVMGNHCRRI
jgi:hypothetical protein